MLVVPHTCVNSLPYYVRHECCLRYYSKRKRIDYSKRKRIVTDTREMIRIGALGVAIQAEAAHYSSDQKEVSRLRTRTVMHMVRASCAKDSGSTATIECIEEGMVQRKTSLGRSTMTPCFAPTPTGD